VEHRNTIDVSALTQLPTPFVGVLDIQITGGSAVGIMALSSAAGDVYEYRKPLAAGAAGSCLPRVLKHVNEGGVTRSTDLFVANAAAQMANANLVFYDSTGAPVAAAGQNVSLQPNGSRYFRLTEITDLPNGIWSACASGDRPLALEELTRADIPLTSLASSGTHGAIKLGESDSTAVTHLVRSNVSYTAFSIQNTGIAAADVDLRYYDLSGTLVHTDTVNLPPMGWARFDQSSQPGLQDGFEGSQVLSSSQPLVSLVDAYVPPNPNRAFLPLVLQ
jgi:hypothetical protein